MSHVLDKHIAAFPALESQIHGIRTLYAEKLWHQLSEELLVYIDNPLLSKDQALINLYTGFVRELETKVDPLKLVLIANAASDQFNTHDERVSFLRDLQKRVKDEQANLLAEIKIGLHHLDANNLDGANNLIKEVTKRVDDLRDPDALLYSHFYYLCAHYHALKRNYEDFYKFGLQYLAYTPETSIRAEKKVQLSIEMAVAVLVSKNIYNFSELLEQPVFKALKGTQYEWLYDLIGVFNTGDVTKYQGAANRYSKEISTTATLKDNVKTLEEKIRIMALLELIFSLPKNDRNVSFSAISKVTGLDLETVEPLVMRAMSLELIKGGIDEIDQVVRISWVVPRVLDTDRISKMKDKIQDWTQSLDVLIKQIEAANSFN